MNPVLEALVAFLLVFGGAFALIGSFGLARLPDLVTRLHGPTKVSTLGVGAILLASMIWFPASGRGFTAHELLILLFLFLTAPISGLMIAKGWMHRTKIERERNDPRLPAPPSSSTDWATFAGRTSTVDDPGPRP